jgi:hypothetical protein
MVSCLNEICALVSVSGDVTAVEEIITPPDLCSLHSDQHSLQSQLQCYLNLKMKLMNSDSKLETIYRRCRNRPLEDKKVAPGSNLVQRTALDVRYLLSLLCLNIGQLEELQEKTVRKRDSPVIHAYREAITWFPRSIEGGFALGTALRHIVTTEDELLLVQEFWEKGWIGAQQSISSIPSECQCSLCQQNIQRLNDRIISRARDASQQLRSSLILHYCQAGRMDLATPLLVAGRFVLVLSQEILHYPLSASASVSAQETRQAICSNAMGVDNILPAHYLRRLQSIFRSQSPFWSEHHYDFFSNASRSVGYFSYLYHFRDSAATAGPKNVIEQVIQRIYQVVIKKFPEVESEATVGQSISFPHPPSLHTSDALPPPPPPFILWWVHLIKCEQLSGGFIVDLTPVVISFTSIQMKLPSMRGRLPSIPSSPASSTSPKTICCPRRERKRGKAIATLVVRAEALEAQPS